MLITTPAELAALPWSEHHHGAYPGLVVLGDPGDFDVVDVRNPHMEGHAGGIDRPLARAQWEAFRAALLDLGLRVEVLPAHAGLVDLVFVRNPFLAGREVNGRPFALLSRMNHPGRSDEVPHAAEWLQGLGIETRPLGDGVLGSWEGGGDNLWHPEHRILWAGSGFRSTPDQVAAVAERLQLPSIHVELIDPAFYHLDTCLMPLDARTAAWVPDAFSAPSRLLIEGAFETLVALDDREAREGFACNFCCPDGRRVLLPSGNPKTRDRFRELGFEVRELDTSEFKKSGGSLFCMSHEFHV